MLWLRRHWPRLLGLTLLGILLWQVEVQKVFSLLQRIAWLPFIVAAGLNLPQISLKGLRWKGLLHAQRIHYETKPLLLAYWGSIFIGLLTPGRLGEFVKVLHVTQDCHISSAKAFTTVVVDRIFDLYALLLVGVAGTLTFTLRGQGLEFAVAALLLALPLAFLLSDRIFGWFQRLSRRLGFLQRLFAPEGWLEEVRFSLRQLAGARLLLALGLTAAAYALFFGQCYLLALSLGMEVGFIPLSYAVAIGSLVTLLPLSISGLGTRDAALIAYLGMVGILPETALAFSLLVFIGFYVVGGLMGAVAWWLKPVSLRGAR